ncbi:hypothetical protein D3C84_945420 [compost metagenome]
MASLFGKKRYSDLMSMSQRSAMALVLSRPIPPSLSSASVACSIFWMIARVRCWRGSRRIFKSSEVIEPTALLLVGAHFTLSCPAESNLTD